MLEYFKKFYPKFLVDFTLESQLSRFKSFKVLNAPEFSLYKEQKIIIYSNHFYYYDVHILNRLRKTILKDRKILIWMEEYRNYPYFEKFAKVLPFKTTHEKIISMRKTIELLNTYPQKYYFFIFPEGVLHSESEGILNFNLSLYKFLEYLKPFVSIALVFKILNNQVLVKFGEFERNVIRKEALENLYDSL